MCLAVFRMNTNNRCRDIDHRWYMTTTMARCAMDQREKVLDHTRHRRRISNLYRSDTNALHRAATISNVETVLYRVPRVDPNRMKLRMMCARELLAGEILFPNLRSRRAVHQSPFEWLDRTDRDGFSLNRSFHRLSISCCFSFLRSFSTGPDRTPRLAHDTVCYQFRQSLAHDA